MKILHTSDWHLGARLCDKDRIKEHKQFLEWLLREINNHSIDILLVSGDIFDSTNPPNSAEKLYYDFLCSLKETCCCAAVIIGGNHDSISKIDSPKELLSHLSIFVNGGISEMPENDVIEITNKKNELIAIVSAVPYLRERDIHIPIPGESWKERETAVSEGIKNYYHQSCKIAELFRNKKEIPLIAMGHLFTTGSLSGAGERDLYVGTLGSLSAKIFPESFSYIALGHIHRSQKVSGKNSIRYCGSPIQMDFGEKENKEVLISYFNGVKLDKVESIKVPLFKKLIRFQGTFSEICEKIDNFVVPEITFWADAEVTGGDALGDINSILNNKASSKGFDFLRIRITGIESEQIFSTLPSTEIKDLSIEEVFLKRCEKGKVGDKEISELLPLHNELLIAVQNRSITDED